MDSLLLLLAGMTLLSILGAMASGFGVDSRDTYGDDHNPAART